MEMDRTKKKLLFFVILFAMTAVFSRQSQAAGQKNSDIPLPARIALSEAGKLMNRHSYDQALEILRAFQAKCGSSSASYAEGCRHPEVFFASGCCHMMKNRWKQAAEAFEQTVKKDPAHVSAWLNLAKACYELGDYSRAGHAFSKAYDSGSDKNPEHLYYSAAAYLMAKQPDPGIAAFEKLFRNHPGKVRTEWRENLVHAMLTANRQKQALPHIRLLAEHYSGEKQVQWQEILLHQYMQLGMRKEACNYAEFLTRQSPTCSKWWKALAHVELQDSKHKSALVALTIYSYLESLSEQEAGLLADLHMQVGIPSKAAPLYESSLRNRFDSRMLQNFVIALQQTGQSEKALEVLKRFAPGSKEPEMLRLKNNLLYHIERTQETDRACGQMAKTASRQGGPG
ncbi:MAG: tetratricopeptide repeat protein [Desulfococcaceae bacterium]